MYVTSQQMNHSESSGVEQVTQSNEILGFHCSENVECDPHGYDVCRRYCIVVMT